MRLRILCFLLFTSTLAFAQEPGTEAIKGGGRKGKGSAIVDDSTRQIYGPKTTRFYYEEEVFFNSIHYKPIDTAIRNYHKFTYREWQNNQIQDLGVTGTPMNPIFYTIPDQIGATSGYNALDLLWKRERVRHYDTKSPYTNMNVVLGGRGRSVTRVTYTRNVNPRWNVGFTYRGIFIDKPLQRLRKGDRNVKSVYYDFHSAYKSVDSSYRAFFTFRREKYFTYENGGVYRSATSSYADFFDVNAQPNLFYAVNNDYRNTLHLYQQYALGKGFQLYTTTDFYRQRNKFTENPALERKNVFDVAILESDTVNDKLRFRSFRNEAGIKGTIGGLFYNGYVAIRSVKGDFSRIKEDTLKANLSPVESYLGGRLALKLDSIFDLNGHLEIQQNGNYQLRAQVSSPWLDAHLVQAQYAPTFVQQAYRGTYDLWNYNFDPVNVTRIGGNLHYRSRVFSISPGLSFTRLGNYVYFREDTSRIGQTVLPEQIAADQLIFTPVLNIEICMLKHIYFKSNTQFTRKLNEVNNSLPMPDLLINAQLSYENIFFDRNLDMQAGLDFHWRSGYYVPGYDVPTMQFFTQSTFYAPSFPVIDLFFDAKIKRGRIFLRFNNVMQFFTDEGYMTTRYYPGQRNTLDFGFDLDFYD